MFTTTELLPTVHANKSYGPDKLRHFNAYPSQKFSVSGQFESINFQTLVKKIQEFHAEKPIYFVDTRQDTHFELNDRAVRIESDDNRQMNSDQIMEREEKHINELLGKEVLFTGHHIQDTVEKITSISTVKQFVENPKYGSHNTYLRFAVDTHGPLTDCQVDQYLELLEKTKLEDIWIHTNSIVGGAGAMLLAVMKDILENAASESLPEIIGRYGGSGNFLKEPKADDENAPQKKLRSAFLENFHTYAKTISEHHLKWSDWKTRVG